MNAPMRAALLATMVALAACSPGETHGTASLSDDHFACAALIGAADQLIAKGKLSADGFADNDRLLAGTSHLNAWAIPEGLKEKEAYDAVKRERDRIIADLTPDDIGKRAGACAKAI